MRKLTLALDTLQVESFDTAAVSGGAGTVHGHEPLGGASYPNACFPPSGSMEPDLDTCGYATCAGNTCWESCNGSCNCGASAYCVPESAGYTYCIKDASCLNGCFPTP